MEYYTRIDLEKIARRIWWGKFPRLGDQKTAYAPYLGINIRKANFAIRTYRWQKVGEFEIYIESQARGDFGGTISVRRTNENPS